MGDRCYVNLTCHELAVVAFEELGFTIIEDPEDGSLNMEDIQANYASQEPLVAPQLTVVMSTTVPRDAEAHARDARAASEESSAAAARETPAVPGWSSNDP